jgi:hypothetical protein
MSRVRIGDIAKRGTGPATAYIRKGELNNAVGAGTTSLAALSATNNKSPECHSNSRSEACLIMGLAAVMHFDGIHRHCSKVS